MLLFFPKHRLVHHDSPSLEDELSLGGSPAFQLRLVPALAVHVRQLGDSSYQPNGSWEQRGRLASGTRPRAWEARWIWMQRGRDCRLSVAVQVPYAQGQPWMAWMVWSKTVSRSFMAANILCYLHQSQTDLVLLQVLWKETLSWPTYVRHKVMPLK